MSNELSVRFPEFEDYASAIPNGLKNRISKTQRLEMMASSVDFIPLSSRGDVLKTSTNPTNDNYDENTRFLKAARILKQNPLCYIATKALQDEVTSAQLVVEEFQNGRWNPHEENEVAQLLDSPNEYMDKNDFLRAWVAHLPNFGFVQAQLFVKGDVMPCGRVTQQDVALNIPFPTQLRLDTAVPGFNSFLYQPIGYKDPVRFSGENVFIDRNYDPINPYSGISAPVDALDRIFKIDDYYNREMSDFFEDGGMPRGLLIRRIDQAKEPKESMMITDANLQEAVQNMYHQVNNRHVKRNIAALRGDWDYRQLSAALTDLLQKDLTHYVQTLVAGTYGVPASLFWVGLELSNQRASREMDAIGFYERTIWNLMQRISSKLNKHLLPKFPSMKKFRVRFDVNEMPLAQALRLQRNREIERWFQVQLINRGAAFDFMGLDSTQLSEEEKKEMYQGGRQAGADLNIGAGGQSQMERMGRDE